MCDAILHVTHTRLPVSDMTEPLHPHVGLWDSLGVPVFNCEKVGKYVESVHFILIVALVFSTLELTIGSNC